MTDHIAVTQEDATRIVVMRRPDKKNALTQDMYFAICEALDSAQDDPSVRCLIIAGSGGAFTAGNDLKDFLAAGTSNAAQPRGTSGGGALLQALLRNQKPLVAAVDGIAIGIGTTMMFHCDYVVATKAASFSTPFVGLGLVPEGASSLLAPRAMGHQRAFAMLVMGRALDGEAAREAGFVNEVAPPGEAEAIARKIAREIAALPAEAVAASRRLMRGAPDEIAAQIDEEAVLFKERLQSDEARAAFAAFFNRKR
jgi:enoyl-CoA hydratase/carnithine racemase